MDTDPLALDELCNSKLECQKLLEQTQEIDIKLQTMSENSENDCGSSVEEMTTQLFNDPVKDIYETEMDKFEYFNGEFQDEATIRTKIEASSSKPHKCSACRKMLVSLEDLQVHMGEVHNKKLKCPHCVQCFSRKIFLEKHLKAHKLKRRTSPADCTSLEPIICVICDFVTSSQYEVDVHIATHRDECPFECPDCADLFEHINIFQEHIKLQHTKKEEKAEIRAQNPLLSEIQTQSLQISEIRVPSPQISEIRAQSPQISEIRAQSRQMSEIRAQSRQMSEIKPQSPQISGCSEKRSPAHSRKIVVPEKSVVKSSSGNETATTCTCNICGRSFTNDLALNVHLKQHNEPPTVRKRKLPTPLTWQKKDNKIRQFQCHECDRSFTLAKTLALHNRRTHLGIKPYKCSTCNWDFAQSSDLIRHQRKHTGERPFKCEFCEMCFSQKRNLMNHTKIHTQKSSKCKYCSNEFQLETSLVQHLKKHEGEHASPCPHCEIPYSTANYLNLHIKREHSSTTHLCSYCDKVYTTANALNRHARKHTGELPFTCQVCGKSFTLQTILNNHQVIHSGKKDFQCTYCGQSFSYAGNLKVHIRTHTGEKPFDCKVCQKSFTRTPNLTEHMKTHTGEKEIKCEVCGKAFASLSTYVKHKKIHTGERPHKCHICNQSFRQSVHLRKHILVHTGERPYPCKICGKFFRRTDSLRVHQRKHSSDKDNNESTTESRNETLVAIRIEIIDNK